MQLLVLLWLLLLLLPCATPVLLEVFPRIQYHLVWLRHKDSDPSREVSSLCGAMGQSKRLQLRPSPLPLDWSGTGQQPRQSCCCSRYGGFPRVYQRNLWRSLAEIFCLSLNQQCQSSERS